MLSEIAPLMAHSQWVFTWRNRQALLHCNKEINPKLWKPKEFSTCFSPELGTPRFYWGESRKVTQISEYRPPRCRRNRQCNDRELSMSTICNSKISSMDLCRNMLLNLVLQWRIRGPCLRRPEHRSNLKTASEDQPPIPTQCHDSTPETRLMSPYITAG